MAAVLGGAAPHFGDVPESEVVGPPPGLMGDRFSSTSVMQQKNLALVCENERLAEENARLVQARLAQERAMLIQENAHLQMQMQMQMYAQAQAQVGQPLDPWSMPLGMMPHMGAPPGPYPPGCPPRIAQPQQPAYPPGSLQPRKDKKDKSKAVPASRSKWPGSDAPDTPPRDNSSSVASTAAESSSKAERSDDSEDSATEHTTVMMRNIPNNYTRTMLLELIDSEGFKGCYNLVYIPIDFNSDAGFGYAFINLVSSKMAERLRAHFQGFTGWSMTSEKVCDVMWSGVHQGLEAHIERYRNSPVMHESVPDEFKPAIFQDGVRIPFPPPTKAPRAPRIRRRNQTAS